MKIENIDIQAAIDNSKKLITEDKSLPPAVVAVIDLLLMIITLLVSPFNVVN